MTKPIYILILALTCIAFTSTDCKKDTCPTCPSPPTDSTSHNFTFQTFSFGGAGGSQLYDVAIINDSLAYAVGAIYLNDSTGQPDLFPYNLAMWNGISWKLQKIPYYYQGQTFYSSIHSIFVFNSNDIWFEAGIHWDGYQFNSIPSNIDFPSHVNKMWGTSSNDLYLVGNSGLIAHRDASGSWTKIESGTTLPINDIYGAYNPVSKQWEVLAVASDDVNKKLLRIQGTSVSALPDDSLSNSLYGVWFVPCEKYYVVGAGIGFKNSLDHFPWYVYPSGVVTSYMSNGVRGNNVNDIFVTGSFFEIVHYNGSSWHNYKDVIPFADGGVGRVAVKGNLMVTVGLSGQNAVAIVGKR
jgi:hypothetical protein